MMGDRLHLPLLQPRLAFPLLVLTTVIASGLGQHQADTQSPVPINDSGILR
jgi:hypothetical protein